MSLRIIQPLDDWDVFAVLAGTFGTLAAAPASNLKTLQPKEVWQGASAATAGYIQFDFTEGRTIDTVALLFTNLDYQKTAYVEIYDTAGVRLTRSPILIVGHEKELIQNAGFEDGLLPWIASNGGVRNASATAFMGGFVLSTGGVATNGTIAQNPTFDIDPSRLLRVDGWVRSTVGADGIGRFSVTFYTAAGAGITTAFSPNLSPTANVWTLTGATFTPPANAAKAKVEPYVGTMTTGQWDFDEIHARQPDRLPGNRRHVFFRLAAALTNVRYARIYLNSVEAWTPQIGRAVIGLSVPLQEKWGINSQPIPWRNEAQADDGTRHFNRGEGTRQINAEAQFATRTAMEDALDSLVVGSQEVLIAHNDDAADLTAQALQRRLYYGIPDVSQFSSERFNRHLAQLSLRSLT
jgi:hypothetical protein